MNKKVRPSKIVESKELLDRLTHVTNIGQFDTLTEAHEAFKKFIKNKKKGWHTPKAWYNTHMYTKKKYIDHTSLVRVYRNSEGLSHDLYILERRNIPDLKMFETVRYYDAESVGAQHQGYFIYDGQRFLSGTSSKSAANAAWKKIMKRLEETGRSYV